MTYIIGVLLAYAFIDMHNLSLIGDKYHPINALYSWYTVLKIFNQTLED
jgi:hypothetical protein